MITDIVNYLRKNIKKGYTLESLKWALVNQGYSKREIDKALNILNEDLAKKAPVLKTKPEIRYEIIEPEEFASTHESKKSWWDNLF